MPSLSDYLPVLPNLRMSTHHLWIGTCWKVWIMVSMDTCNKWGWIDCRRNTHLLECKVF